MTATQIFEKSNSTLIDNVSWSGINLDTKQVEFGLSLGEDFKQEKEENKIPSYKSIMISNHIVSLQENLSPLGLKIVYKELRDKDLVFNVVEG